MLEMSKTRHSPCVLDSGPAVWEGARGIPILVCSAEASTACCVHGIASVSEYREGGGEVVRG